MLRAHVFLLKRRKHAGEILPFHPRQMRENLFAILLRAQNQLFRVIQLHVSVPPDSF